MTEIELELTYLAAELPAEIHGVTPKRIVDVYIPDLPGDHPNLRLRAKGDSYTLTKKEQISKGDASAHTETTIKLSEEEFRALEVVSVKRVVKDRYFVTMDGYSAEVDVFREELEGLVLIDFEFASQESMDSFSPPSACLLDVTQEEFIAGGMLAGKSYTDITPDLARLGYSSI